MIPVFLCIVFPFFKSVDSSRNAAQAMGNLPTLAKRVLWTPLEEEILKQEV